MEYEPLSQRVVMFGGLSDCGGGRTDTYLWNGAAWEAGPLSGIPAHRSPKAWFDPAAGRVRFFGGYNGNYLADMWE